MVSLPLECRVTIVPAGGPGDPAWAIFFVEDMKSMEKA